MYKTLRVYPTTDAACAAGSACNKGEMCYSSLTDQLFACGSTAQWAAMGGGGGGWTDDGTVVRLTTSADNVGIGTTSLALDGTITNPVELNVQPTINFGTAVIKLGSGSPSTGNGLIEVGCAGYLSGDHWSWNPTFGINLAEKSPNGVSSIWYTPQTTIGRGYAGLSFDFSGNAHFYGYNGNTTAGVTVIPSEKMTILSNGSVGIGIAGPGNKLAVNLTDNDGIILNQATASKQAYVIFADQGTAKWQFGKQTDNSLFMYDNVNIKDFLRVNTAGTLSLQPVSGNVGIGAAAPGLRLQVAGAEGLPATSGTTQTGMMRVGSGSLVMDMGMSTIPSWNGWIQVTSKDNLVSTYNLLLNPNGGSVGIGTPSPSYTLSVAGTIWANGSFIVAGASTWSDARLKENIRSIDDPLMKIIRLKGIYYDWKKNEFTKNFSDGRQIGIIAQEMEKEFPELVGTDNQGYKTIAYDKFTAVLLEAVKAQQKEIEGLRSSVAELNKKLEAKK